MIKCSSIFSVEQRIRNLNGLHFKSWLFFYGNFWTPCPSCGRGNSQLIFRRGHKLQGVLHGLKCEYPFLHFHLNSLYYTVFQ